MKYINYHALRECYFIYKKKKYIVTLGNSRYTFRIYSFMMIHIPSFD